MKKLNKKTTKISKKEIITKPVCDRCGNDNHIFSNFYFPYRKLKLDICDICWMGLMTGLTLDLERLMKLGIEDFYKTMK